MKKEILKMLMYDNKNANSEIILPHCEIFAQCIWSRHVYQEMETSIILLQKHIKLWPHSC